MSGRRVLSIGTGAAILTGGAYVAASAFIAESIKTGVKTLDRPGVRYRIAELALRTFGPKVVTDLRIPRALMAIVNNESRGDPKFTLGDTGASGGPSIGLMQVYRRTAVDMGLWKPPAGASDEEVREAYAALAKDEALGIAWGVKVFADKLRIAKGDLSKAVRLYNGSGPSAEAYRDRALAFGTSKGWVIA